MPTSRGGGRPPTPNPPPTKEGADPRGMERLLLWSAITRPGKLGGGGIFEPRDVRPGTCFTVQGGDVRFTAFCANRGCLG
eukprot:3785296-Prymnesium_polylepis.1